VPRRGDAGAWWKSRIFDCPVAADPTAHRVVELRKLATAIGVTGWADIVCPQGTSVNDIAPKGAYAVIHANPMYRYKRWVDAGWRELARALTARGLDVVATEGREPAERDYADRLWEAADPPVIRERGRLDWPGLASLLKGAAVYAGPDTSMTHLAAGAGCPTVALYGPTSPRLIGPWPVGGLDESWAERGTIQRRGNVWLVQNPLPCLPCEKLGCERHLESYSRCLDELTPAQVLRAVDEALESRRASTLQPQAPRVAAR
jgi:heptosyltransferase-3